jgi:hypothetical protein
VDAVRGALEAVASSAPPDAGALGKGDRLLWAARLERTASGARDALESFRRTAAAWWIAQALELLEELGDATVNERAERASIEARLRATA